MTDLPATLRFVFNDGASLVKDGDDHAVILAPPADEGGETRTVLGTCAAFASVWPALRAIAFARYDALDGSHDETTPEQRTEILDVEIDKRELAHVHASDRTLAPRWRAPLLAVSTKLERIAAERTARPVIPDRLRLELAVIEEGGARTRTLEWAEGRGRIAGESGSARSMRPASPPSGRRSSASARSTSPITPSTCAGRAARSRAPGRATASLDMEGARVRAFEHRDPFVLQGLRCAVGRARTDRMSAHAFRFHPRGGG